MGYRLAVAILNGNPITSFYETFFIVITNPICSLCL